MVHNTEHCTYICELLWQTALQQASKTLALQQHEGITRPSCSVPVTAWTGLQFTSSQLSSTKFISPLLQPHREQRSYPTRLNMVFLITMKTMPWVCSHLQPTEPQFSLGHSSLGRSQQTKSAAENSLQLLNVPSLLLPCIQTQCFSHRYPGSVSHSTPSGNPDCSPTTPFSLPEDSHSLFVPSTILHTPLHPTSSSSIAVTGLPYRHRISGSPIMFLILIPCNVRISSADTLPTLSVGSYAHLGSRNEHKLKGEQPAVPSPPAHTRVHAHRLACSIGRATATFEEATWNLAE